MTEIDRTVATKRDLAEGNFDKVFPNGFAADKFSELEDDAESEQSRALVQDAAAAARSLVIAPRPTFGVSAREIDALKMMSMVGPMIPAWLQNDPARCWGIVELSKRWTRYDRSTNSWIHFDPIAIAQSTYLVESNSGGQRIETVSYMSVFIRALIDAFAPLQRRLRYAYDGEGQERVCLCSGLLTRETEPHIYRSPSLKLITPKKSPLWQADPDRQLAYYASRAWSRLYCAGVLLGVYDVDEVEGRVIAGPGMGTPTAVPANGLHARLQAARADPLAERREGFREGVVDAGLAKSGSARAARKPTRAKKAATPSQPTPPKKERKAAAKAGGKPASKRPAKADPAPNAPSEHIAEIQAAEAEQETRREEVRSAVAAKAEQPAKQAAPPKNLGQYREHLRRWLVTMDTEEKVEERWRVEMKLRNICGVTADEKSQLRADFVDQRIVELRGAE